MIDPLPSPFLFTSGATSIQQHQWPCTVPSLRKIGSLPTRRLRFDFSHSAALLGSIMRAALQCEREMKYNSSELLVRLTFTLQRPLCNLKRRCAWFDLKFLIVNKGLGPDYGLMYLTSDAILSCMCTLQ